MKLFKTTSAQFVYRIPYFVFRIELVNTEYDIRYTKYERKRGFTVLETLVSVAILMMMTAVAFTVFVRYNREQALVTETDMIVTMLTDARAKTLYSQNASQYGVHFASTSITQFAGSAYSSSDPNNVVYVLNTVVQVSTTTLSSGGSDVVFSRLTGNASATGTVYVLSKTDMTSRHVMQILGTGVVERIQ